MKKLRHDAQTRAVLAALGFDCSREDAGESLFLLQELQAIEQRIYETPFGPRKAEMLIPMEPVPPGAQEWGYDRITLKGMAKWIAADARDIPNANVERVRQTFPMHWYGDGYKYTIRDLQAAAFSGQPLEDHLARAARIAVDQFRNKVMLQGDSTVGLTGFINDPNVTQDTAAGEWDGTDSTPDEIIAEFNQVIFSIGVLTKENYWPDTLVVPASVYAHLTTTPRSSTSDTTIWEYMKANNQYVKNLEMLVDLGTVADGGIAPGESSTGRAIFYKKSADVVVGKVGIVFEQLPPQARGYGFEVPCHGSTGGCHWRVPIAGYYLDGVS